MAFLQYVQAALGTESSPVALCLQEPICRGA